MTKHHLYIAATGLLCLTAAAAPADADVITDWNAVTVSCGQGPPSPPNRVGPPGLIDIAVVQLAVHDAVQAIEGRFETYQYNPPWPRRTDGSIEAAAAAAAYYTLAGMYGSDDPCLAGVTDPALVYVDDDGVRVGKEAAAALLPHYRATTALPTDPFVGGTEPGQWRPTPGSTQGANTWMGNAPPFALEHSWQFRPGPPPALKSFQYLRDYNEVKRLGSATSTERSEEQTELARFWSINFIAQWYSVVRAIADAHVADIGDKARLLALIAVAAADSQISVYDAKYVYNFWRPITAIQNGDADGNDWTKGDPAWTSFSGNPPYPDWTSGANMLTASITGIMQFYFRTDKFDFTVSSTAAGLAHPTRQYRRFSQVQQEVVDVRVYQGIHFRTADEEGRRQGIRVAAWTFNTQLRPLPYRKDWHWVDAY